MNGIYTDGPFPLSGILSAANPSDMITASLVVIIPIHHKLPHLYRCGSLLLLWKFRNNTQMISGVQIDSISLLTGVSDILTIVLSFSIFFSSLRYHSESFFATKKAQIRTCIRTYAFATRCYYFTTSVLFCQRTLLRILSTSSAIHLFPSALRLVSPPLPCP